MKSLPYFSLFLILILSACDSATTELPNKNPDTPKLQTGNSEAALPIVSRCTSCHGKYGDLSMDGAPFLSGQSEQYLVTAMTGYVTDVRKHAPMKRTLGFLSENDRLDLAAYFANSKRAWKASAIKRTNQKDPQQIVEELSKRGKIVPCASCHGDDGNSPNAGVPSLATLTPEYIEIALNGYLNGERVDPFMSNFKLALTGVDIKSLAQYFATHQPKKTRLPSKGNIAAGKKASRQCVGCHGLKGNSPVPSIPSLAGQNTSYLIDAMQTYKKGTRKNRMMRDAIKQVNNKTIIDIAAYYASQTPTKSSSTSKRKFTPLEDGEKIATVCNACHGKNGNSTQAEIPSLTRLHPTYLRTAIKNYKNGNRRHKVMSTLVAYLSDVEIDKVALYYETQSPAMSKYHGKGNDKEARKIVAQCNNCHGNNGNSDKVKIPSLAGQSAQYLERAIYAYRSDKRRHEDMKNAVKELSPQDIANIATYYASRKPHELPKRAFLSPKKLSKKCDRCHGEKGFSTNPAVPRLAGQVPAYIEHALLDYQSERRTHSAMRVMSEVLSLVEINAIAQYYFEQGQNR